mgnify:CR=1 FL=1
MYDHLKFRTMVVRNAKLLPLLLLLYSIVEKDWKASNYVTSSNIQWFSIHVSGKLNKIHVYLKTCRIKLYWILLYVMWTLYYYLISVTKKSYWKKAHLRNHIPLCIHIFRVYFCKFSATFDIVLKLYNVSPINCLLVNTLSR